MKYVADLHLHSRYSRAVSQDMNLETMAKWALKKGLNILSTGDWTHPIWLREIKSKLVEENGLFKLKTGNQNVRFLLSTEISSIYSEGGKVRRIHSLIFVPSFDTAEKISRELIKRGANLNADGRPIIGLSARNLLDLTLSLDKNALFIPAHVWTPWFSLYGSNSGFDSIDECFGDLSKHIYGVETGLSSDPLMNWRIKELNKRAILSFSDAHSAPKMGREATVFDLKELSYDSLREAIVKNSENRILSTIEFYPEEGKYHYDGHRNCGVSQTPTETKQNGIICPKCKRKLTIGVMNRVEQLANGDLKISIKPSEVGVGWVYDETKLHPPFVKLVPLNEIIAEALSSTTQSQKAKNAFDEMCDKFGSELEILLKTPKEELEKYNAKIAEGVSKVRVGDISIMPGFDGEYGKVKIWSEENSPEVKKAKESQLGLF